MIWGWVEFTEYLVPSTVTFFNHHDSEFSFIPYELELVNGGTDISLMTF